MLKSPETFPSAHFSALLPAIRMNRPNRSAFTLASFASTTALLLSAYATTQPEPKLFDRLGGLSAITPVLDKTVNGASTDPRTRRNFEYAKLARRKESVTARLCAANGGHCKYEDASTGKACTITVADAETGATFKLATSTTQVPN